MSLQIERFIDRLRAQDAQGSRTFTMTIEDAKGLHGEITKLLMRLEATSSQETASNIEVEIRAPSFKD